MRLKRIVSVMCMLLFVGVLLECNYSQAKVYISGIFPEECKTYTFKGTVKAVELVNKYDEPLTGYVLNLRKKIKVKDSNGDITKEKCIQLAVEDSFFEDKVGKMIKVKGKLMQSLSSYTYCRYELVDYRIIE